MMATPVRMLLPSIAGIRLTPMVFGRTLLQLDKHVMGRVAAGASVVGSAKRRPETWIEDTFS